MGRLLIDMTGVSTRWAAGDLGSEHSSAIASVLTDDTREACGEWEGWLARETVDLDMRGLRKVLAKWRLEVDPDNGEPGRIERDRYAHVASPSAAARLRPLVVVVAGLDALAGGLAELWNETPLSPRQLARILGEDPDLERYLYRPGQVPIASNERHRFFTGKLRRAIQVRGRHCTARGCDRPAENCDIDHIEPVTTGGATRPDNGRVACNPDN